MVARKTSARAQILKLLKRVGAQTAQAIAHGVGISAVGARKHLDALVAEGLVRIERRPVPRGRPTYVYVLTAAAESLFPQSYSQLAVDLLRDLSQTAGDETLGRLFETRNERVARSYEQRIAGLPLSERLAELARARDEEGYMANLKEDNGIFILEEHNCPILDVGAEFRQACQCEQAMFTKLLNRKVERETSLAEGSEACRYRIEP